MALSRDLLAEYPYGTTIVVSGCEVEEYNGTWVVQDTMNKRYTERLDFLISPGMRVTNKQVKIEKQE